jgi:hypothetical protein
VPLAKQAGQPTKFNSATVDQLCAALADGMPIRGACIVAGIGVTTLAEWRTQKPGVETRLEEARELARKKALQAIKSAGEKDWRASAEWLRLVFPADYRGNAHRIDVSATARASSGVVLTEERRRALQQARHAALAGISKN